MLKDYLRMAVFAMGLLMGVQIPALVDQYQKRIDAQLSEARLNLEGFQGTADRFFSGDLEKLLTHYQTSDDAVFKSDAVNLAFIFNRVDALQQHLISLNKAGVFKPLYLALQQDTATMQATLDQYSYLVPLSPQALLWGALVAIVFASLLDLLMFALRYVFSLIKRKKHQ